MATSEQLKPAYPLPALRPTSVESYSEVQLQRTHDGRVATILWNPPKRMNPLSVTLTDELVAAVEDASADERLNIVVLRGAGGYFSVGDDLVEMHAKTSAALREAAAEIRRLRSDAQLSRGDFDRTSGNKADGGISNLPAPIFWSLAIGQVVFLIWLVLETLGWL